MSNAEFSQELDEQQLIFRQIERYQKTWNKIQKTRHKGKMGKVSHDDNLDVVRTQAWQHAKGLRGIIKPKVSGDEKKDLTSINDPKNAEELFNKCLDLLYQQNIMWENNSGFVVEDKSNSKVEPEDSEVSEEVM